MTRHLLAEEQVAAQMSDQTQLQEHLQQSARSVLQGGKFQAILRERYAGDIANPEGWELVAYRRWLEEHERNGDFRIFDPHLREQFLAVLSTAQGELVVP